MNNNVRVRFRGQILRDIDQRKKKKRQQDLWHAQVRQDGRMKLKEIEARTKLTEIEGLK